MRGRKLSEFIDDYILEKDSLTKHDKPRLMRLAVRGLQEMWIDVNGYPSVVLALVDEEHQSVAIPDDMISEPSIFIPAGEKLIPVPKTSASSRLNMGIASKTGAISRVNSQPVQEGESFPGYASFNSPDWLPNHYRNFDFMGRFFGQPGGSIFTHQVNESAGVIEFSSSVCGYVVIEYMASLPKDGKNFYVHPSAEESIISWLNWVTIRSLRSVSPGEKDYYKQEHFRAKRWARKRFHSENRAAMVEAKTSAMNQTTRF